MVGLRFWRVGVLGVTRLLFRDGIHLIGLPASPAARHRRLFALSTLQDSRFNASTRRPRQLSMPPCHVSRGRFVSALLPGLSPYVFADVARLQCRAEFPQTFMVRKPSASSPTLNNNLCKGCWI